MRHLPADEVQAKRWLLPGDPFRVEKIAKYMDDVVDLGWSREFKMIEGSYHDIPVGVCSTGIGGPSTLIACHELHLLGATHLVRVGTAGAIDLGLTCGTVCVALSAVHRGRHEFASLTDFLCAYSGMAWTTDEFYSNHPAPPEVGFVEMEAAYLFKFANTKSLKAGCVVAISDARETVRYEAGIDKAIVSALDGISR